jgi:putative tricarboxylic transport membrane protein
MTLGRDGIAGLILLALSLFYLYFSFGLPQLPLVPVGPGFYPRIVLIGTALLSAILVLQDWQAHRAPATASEEPTPATAPAAGLVILSFVVFGIYTLLLPLLGYRIATVLFVGLLQGLLDRPRDARQWAKLALVAVVTSAVTYMVFELYLAVLLPRGAWTGW